MACAGSPLGDPARTETHCKRKAMLSTRCKRAQLIKDRTKSEIDPNDSRDEIEINLRLHFTFKKSDHHRVSFLRVNVAAGVYVKHGWGIGS